MTPTLYLLFPGTCLRAMTFYAETLGGQIGNVFKNSDAPNPEDRMPGGDDMVMNMSLSLGDMAIMGSDNSPDWYDKPQGFRISLPFTTRAEFDRVYDALAEDAQNVAMEPQQTFWAARFAMLTDRFGTPWMLNMEQEEA